MSITFKVSKREGKIKDDTLCPGVVSGAKMESVSLEFNKVDFRKLFTEAGYTNIVTLEGLGEPVEAMIHRLDVNSVKNEIRHVEFYAIERGVEMSADVPLVLINEAPANKATTMINQMVYQVHITCMPRNLIHEIEVDTSVLKEIGDAILVKDLLIPKTVTIDLDPETMVISVSAAKAEKKKEDDEPTVNAADVPVVGKEGDIDAVETPAEEVK